MALLEGVTLAGVSNLIAVEPVTLARRHDRVVDGVNAVKNLGLEPEDNMLVYVLGVRMQINERIWKKKIEVMKSLGWSDEETLRVLKQYPHILGLSDKKIRSGLDFFINVIGLERKIIFSHPQLLCFSIDKRIRPRYHVMNVLMSKNLIGKSMKITTLLCVSEKKFVENYVVRYASGVPGLLEMFESTA